MDLDGKRIKSSSCLVWDKTTASCDARLLQFCSSEKNPGIIIFTTCIFCVWATLWLGSAFLETFLQPLRRKVAIKKVTNVKFNLLSRLQKMKTHNLYVILARLSLMRRNINQVFIRTKSNDDLHSLFKEYARGFFCVGGGVDWCP